MELTRRDFVQALTASAASLAAPSVIASPNSWSDLDLILGADISPSVSEERYQRQHKGYAAALRDPNNMNAILASGNIHSCFFQYARDSIPRLPMRRLDSEDAILMYATEIEELPRPGKIHYSYASEALLFGLNVLRNRFDADGIRTIRTKLDISTDGETGVFDSFHHLSDDCQNLKRLAEAEGMQVNALIMRADNDEDGYDPQSMYNLTRTFYERNVITDRSPALPAEGFIKPAPNVSDFVPAMTEKIAAELMM